MKTLLFFAVTAMLLIGGVITITLFVGVFFTEEFEVIMALLLGGVWSAIIALVSVDIYENNIQK